MSKAKRRKGFAKAVLYNLGYTTAAELSIITITNIVDGYLYYTKSGSPFKANLAGVETAVAS